MLRSLQADIEAVRFPTAEGPSEVPVKLKVHRSLFVPTGKRVPTTAAFVVQRAP
jgi:hypothetical protein